MTFVLVHGAYHGPWCWELLVPELAARGHDAVTVDLPVADPTADAAVYADVIDETVASVENPILVAHSMSGIAAPIVAARRPLDLLVFLCGLIPLPGVSMSTRRKQEPVDPETDISEAVFTSLGDGVWMVGEETAIAMFYNDLPLPLAEWAVSMLRPQAYRVFREPIPLETWPQVRCASIVCADDHAVNPMWGRRVAREQLGVAPIELEGGHSPFLGRPAELAEVLVSLTGSPSLTG